MRIVSALTFVAAGVFTTAAQAAGFGIIEQGASGLGAAFAGSASQVNDASIQYFNPAGLAELGRAEVTVALHAIDLSLKYTDGGSALPPAGLGALPAGATSDDAGDVLLVPNLHLALPLPGGFTAGFSASTPYGLETDYEDPWIGRFQGIHSKLETINLNPALAWRMSELLSVGVGASWQRAKATLTNAVMLGAATEGRARLSLDDSAWGWNVGLLLTPHESLRVGVGYRSRIDQNLSGDVAVTTAAGAPVAAASGPTSASIDMPEQGYFSLSQRLGERFTLLADASVTRWGRIEELRAVNSTNGATRDLLSFGFADTWRFALGGEYALNERWTLRGGVARDESPVSAADRTVRLPDEDRRWITVGAQWRLNESFTFDAGYAHIFVDDAAIASTRAQTGGPPSFTSLVRGSYKSKVDILSVQVRYSLDAHL